MGKVGVMLCGHGSRDPGAVAEFAALAAALPAYLPEDWLLAHGYLEFADPVIRDGLDALRLAGCERILAVPGMLFAAMHTKNDVPMVLSSYAAEHGIAVSYGRELGVDPKLIAAGGARIAEALAAADAADGPVSRHDTCLVVIGRGASDPDANANVARVARLLWEGMGFGWCEVGYSGVTFPLVEPCLSHVAKLGYRRVVVFPWFLFSGVLIDRIYGFTDRVAAAHPGIGFVKAGYLGGHPKVLETFAERATEQLGEVPPPNCAMCKYRTQVLGFEAEVGAVQRSHHHHAEGQGAQASGPSVADCRLCDTFCTGECRLEPLAASAGHHGHAHDHGDGRGHGRGAGHGHDHGEGHPRGHGHDHRQPGHDHGHPGGDGHGGVQHDHHHGHGSDHHHHHHHDHGPSDGRGHSHDPGRAGGHGDDHGHDRHRGHGPGPGDSDGHDHGHGHADAHGHRQPRHVHHAGHGHADGHDHDHGHRHVHPAGHAEGHDPSHGHDDAHGHHHPRYPHADHPLGPESARKRPV